MLVKWETIAVNDVMSLESLYCNIKKRYIL